MSNGNSGVAACVTKWEVWHLDDSVLMGFVLKICLLSLWRLQTWAWKQSLMSFILIRILVSCWQVIQMEIRQLNYMLSEYHSLFTGFTGFSLTNKKSTRLIRIDINVGGLKDCSKPPRSCFAISLELYLFLKSLFSWERKDEIIKI